MRTGGSACAAGTPIDDEKRCEQSRAATRADLDAPSFTSLTNPRPCVGSGSS
jgi:hypothetical protein